MATNKNKPEIDELLNQVWAKHTNIIPELDFLNSVFSFLNQRSAYLSEPGNSKKVLQLVNKYIDEAKDLKIKKDKEKETKSSDANKIETTKIKTEMSSAAKSSSNTNESRPKSETTNSQEPVATPSKSAEEKSKDDNTKQEDKSQLNAPVNNGGVTDKYVWTQTLQDIDVRISIPENLKGKDLKVVIEKRRLLVGIKGKPPIVNGDLHDAVSVEESSWTVDKEHGKSDKTLTLSLKKETGMCWWRRVMVGDPEIDTSKIEPENSQLQDLDPETKQTVEKMMVEQRQKMMGIPTQEELQKQQMIEKLKKQFPNMDFSQTKFG